MGSMSIWHWLIVLVVVLLIFAQEIAQHRAGPGGAVKGFKEGVKGAEDASDAPRTPRRRPRSSAARRSRARSRRSAPSRVERPVSGASGARVERPLLDARPPCFDIGISEIMVIAVVALIVLAGEAAEDGAHARPPLRPAAALRRRREVGHQS